MAQWTRFHPAVFLLTFFTYAFYHVVRKTISYVKSSVIAEWTTSPGSLAPRHDVSWSSRQQGMFGDAESAEAFLGVLNATFLFVYAAGLYVSGMLADRLNLRLFLTAGMVTSSLTVFVLGPGLEWTQTHSKAAYLILMVANGLCQSTGWPCVVAAMANWFGKSSRGLVMGVWSASPSVGSMLGALITATVVDYGYEYAFLLTSSSLLAGSVVIFFGLVTSPHDVGLPMPDEKSEDDSTEPLVVSLEVPQYRGKRRQSHSTCKLVRFFFDLFRTKPRISENERLRRKSTQESFYGSTWSLGQGKATASPVKSTFSKSGYVTETSSGHTLNVGFRDTESLLDRNPVSRPLAGTEVATPAVAHVGVLKDSSENSVNEKGRHVCHEDPECSHRDSRKELFGPILYPCKADTKRIGDREVREIAIERRGSADEGNVVSKTLYKQTMEGMEENTEEREKIPKEGKKTSQTRPKAINFFQALFLPGVIPYALAHACIKMVNYVFFFWLPFYLVSNNGWTVAIADKLSICYDVGGITGGTVAGVVSNWLKKQALVVGPMLVLGVPALYVYSSLPAAASDLVVNGALLVVLGFLIGGVANIIAAAIVADLGRQPAIRGSVEAMSTVAGIIEGTGTLGAALGQLAVPYLNVRLGWPAVFYLMMVAIVFTVFSVTPIIVAEVKAVIGNRRQNTHQ